jgi:outer membrane protein assembly factor BamB
VFADWAESGEGMILAVDARGKVVWRHRVSGFPGPHPPWNFGGITTWWVGRYTAKDRYDVWVSARRSTMHSDEAWVVRGTDGKAVWHLREVRTDRTSPSSRGWGAGGTSVCSTDVDGDGLEDVVSLYPVNYMAAKGTSGELIHSVEASAGLFEGVWGAYAHPIVADFNGDGEEELLWCGGYHHGLTTLDARVLWYHKGAVSLAGVGDVDGDGKLELGFAGWEHGSGLRCLDAATGAPRWEWPLEGSPRVPVYSADIDGDGRDEFLFAVGKTLVAVNGKDGAANPVWQVELPAAPGNLAFADVDRDGKLEILCIGADSTLYCLDGG